MSVEINRKEVEHVAELAHLVLSEEEKELFCRQLSEILTYMQTLNELNTEGVEPTSHILPIVNVFREDERTASLPREEALANAPDPAHGFFRVPKIIE